MAKKRYYRTITEAFYADSDEQAIRMSINIMQVKNKHDEHYIINEIVRQDFGKIDETKIYEPNKN